MIGIRYGLQHKSGKKLIVHPRRFARLMGCIMFFGTVFHNFLFVVRLFVQIQSHPVPSIHFRIIQHGNRACDPTWSCWPSCLPELHLIACIWPLVLQTFPVQVPVQVSFNVVIYNCLSQIVTNFVHSRPIAFPSWYQRVELWWRS